MHLMQPIHPYPSFQQHSHTHISPTYLHSLIANINKNKPMTQKLNLQSILNDNKQQQTTDQISVKSFLPEELPQIDQCRKSVKNIQFGSSIAQSQQPKSNLNDIINYTVHPLPDTLDVASQFTIYQQCHEHQQTLPIRQQINLQPNTVNIQHKQLNIYINQRNKKGKYFDNVLQCKKQNNHSKINQELSQNDTYVVTPDLISQVPQNTCQNYPITITFKHPKKYPFSTSNRQRSSKQFLKQPNQSQFDLQTQTQMNWKISTVNSQSRNKFQCSGCKGFYCKDCGSSIPPLYRPIIGNISETHQPINHQQIKSYYTNYYTEHKNDQKASRMTKCSNCQ